MKLDSSEKMDLIPETFYITYYAQKHSKIITRKGLKFKPNTLFQKMKHLALFIGIATHHLTKMETNGVKLLV